MGKKSRKTMPKKIKSTDDDSPTKANGFKMDYKKYSGLCEITVKPCRHLMKLKNSDFKNSSLCNPLQWNCNHSDCSANESLMACLQCSHVACGKYIENHALEHYKQTKHPIMMNIDDQTLYCYRCDDFQMNDDFYMFGGHETIKSLRHRVNMLILERNSTNQNHGRVSMRSRRRNSSNPRTCSPSTTRLYGVRGCPDAGSSSGTGRTTTTTRKSPKTKKKKIRTRKKSTRDWASTSWKVIKKRKVLREKALSSATS